MHGRYPSPRRQVSQLYGRWTTLDVGKLGQLFKTIESFYKVQGETKKVLSHMNRNVHVATSTTRQLRRPNCVFHGYPLLGVFWDVGLRLGRPEAIPTSASIEFIVLCSIEFLLLCLFPLCGVYFGYQDQRLTSPTSSHPTSPFQLSASFLDFRSTTV